MRDENMDRRMEAEYHVKITKNMTAKAHDKHTTISVIY